MARVRSGDDATQVRGPTFSNENTTCEPLQDHLAIKYSV